MPDSVVAFVPRPGGEPTAADGGFYCEYLWDGITVLSDGNVTCGFNDPFGTRSYGNVATASVREIFNGEGMRALRGRLRAGYRCATCHLYAPVKSLGGAPLPAIPEMPRRLILETTIRCNLRCRNTSCDLNNDRDFKVREAPFLDFDLYRKLMDEVGPGLGAMYFFNYGEPFLHPRAADMLAYARAVNPRMRIASSTNGILLARGDTARRIVAEELVHWINFTVAGADDATYQKYHKGGSFEEAAQGMRRLVEEKRRLGREFPTVRWRYLLFNWNDSDAQVARARELAAEIGVDELTFFLCSAPLEGRSWRRAPGTPGFAAIADKVEYEVHYRPDPFADAGLYPPENHAVLGSHCWSSAQATLTVRPQGRRPWLLRGGHIALRLAGRPGEDAPKVRIATPWGERAAVVGQGTWAVNRVSVPWWRRVGEFEVRVIADEPFIPLRHGGPHDTRELGVMVSLDFADDPAVPEASSLQVVAPAGEPEARPASPTGAHEQVAHLYRRILHREADAGGLAFWGAQVEQGMSLAEVAATLITSPESTERAAPIVRLLLAASIGVPSPALIATWLRRCREGAPLAELARVLVARGEFRLRYRGLDPAAFERRFTIDNLGRETPLEATGHADAVLEVAGSEAFAARSAQRVLLVHAYSALMGRAPDVGGYEYWEGFLADGGRLSTLTGVMMASEEFALAR